MTTQRKTNDTAKIVVQFNMCAEYSAFGAIQGEFALNVLAEVAIGRPWHDDILNEWFPGEDEVFVICASLNGAAVAVGHFDEPMQEMIKKAAVAAAIDKIDGEWLEKQKVNFP